MGCPPNIKDDLVTSTEKASSGVNEPQIQIADTEGVLTKDLPNTITGSNEKSPSSNDLEKNVSSSKDVAGSAAEEDNENLDDLEKGSAVKKNPTLAEQTNLLPFRQLIVVFLGCAISLTLSMLDQTIVSNLLPTLARDFNAGRLSTYVATVYLLTSTAFQPLVGRFSDIFGRKRAMLVSIFIFFISSVACSVAQTMIQLIVFRAFQGIGGGSILTLVMIVMSDVVSLKERGKYQGILSIFVALSNGFGPLVGGVIGEKTTWRVAFWLNLPLCAFTFFIIAFFLPLKHVKGSTKTKLGQIDYGGSALVLASSVLILLALNWAGSTYDWSDVHILAPLIIGLAVGAFFIIYEWKIATLPIVPPRLFRSLDLTACYLITATNGVVYYIQLFYLPQYFQILRGDSPIRSGVLLMPLILVMVTISALAGLLTSKTGQYKWVIVSGWAFWTVSLGLISTLNQSSSTGNIVGYLILAGVGAGQTFQTTLVAIQASVSRKDMATATSTRNFIRMLGGTLSLAIAATIISNTLKSQARNIASSTLLGVLDDPTSLYSSSSSLTSAQVQDIRDAYRSGFRIVWLMCTGFGALSTVAAGIFLKNRELMRGDEEAKKKEAAAWLAARKERHAHSHAQDHSSPASDEQTPSVTRT